MKGELRIGGIQMDPLHTLSVTERQALQDLIKVVREKWPSAKFKLFGSKADGTADPESDMDLLVTLACPISEEIRRQIIHKAFDVNLTYESNISVIVVSEAEWETPPLSILPFHASVEEGGISL